MLNYVDKFFIIVYYLIIGITKRLNPDDLRRLINMEKTTQKELRDGIRLGIYTLVNTDNIDEYKGHDIEQIRYCSGTYGINGALYIDHTNNGEMLAVPCRSSALLALS